MLGENLTLGVQKSDYTVSLLVESESHSCAITSLTNSELQCRPDQSLLELLTQSSQSVNSELSVSTVITSLYLSLRPYIHSFQAEKLRTSFELVDLRKYLFLFHMYLERCKEND